MNFKNEDIVFVKIGNNVFIGEIKNIKNTDIEVKIDVISSKYSMPSTISTFDKNIKAKIGSGIETKKEYKNYFKENE